MNGMGTVLKNPVIKVNYFLHLFLFLKHDGNDGSFLWTNETKNFL